MTSDKMYAKAQSRIIADYIKSKLEIVKQPTKWFYHETNGYTWVTDTVSAWLIPNYLVMVDMDKMEHYNLYFLDTLSNTVEVFDTHTEIDSGKFKLHKFSGNDTEILIDVKRLKDFCLDDIAYRAIPNQGIFLIDTNRDIPIGFILGVKGVRI